MRGLRFVIMSALLGVLLWTASVDLNATKVAADIPSAAVTVDQLYPYTYPYYNYGYTYPYYNSYYNYGYTYPYYNSYNYGYTYPYYKSSYNYGYNYPYYSSSYNYGYTYPYYNNSYNYGYNYPYYSSSYYVQPTVSYGQSVTTAYSSPRVIISSATLTQPAPLPTTGSYTSSAYVSSGPYGMPISMLTVATSSALGPHLADGRGMTLYTLSTDAPGRSACVDTCTSVWPPATSSGTLSEQAGLTGTFSSITRADGSIQATYNGLPLYFYSQDLVAGDTKGHGITDQWGTWSVARP